MLAAIFHGPRDIRVEDVPDPVPGPGEALVQVRAAGICGGDLHEYRANRQLYATPYPRPPQGHELAGDVVAAGDGVTRVAPGDRVGVMPMVGCGECDACRHGRMALCPRLEHIGVARGGGFAELCVAPEANLHRLPGGVGFDEAALLDCVAVAVHAVHRVPIPAGAAITVLGTGAIGLAVAQVARAAGAGRVTVVGTRAEPLAIAKRLGADEIVNLGAGRKPKPDAEVVFETAGGRNLLSRAAAAAAPGAKVGLVGETFQPQELDAADAMQRELTFAFVWSYGSWDGRSEYERALDLVAAGRVSLAPCVTHRFPLAEIADAFAAADDRIRSHALKVLVEP
jgi:2-desacetyl-2-hydroxyethyl bacteriochlorophyllide A dehydrogenase